ncbi:hypothetical protein F2Q69_00016128 [Brassica cretica]|uniref:Poly(A) polymerase nucleotidyltransferase domain-containing protein n=1 Tax=Brassica cretica TaxID=69181 RepID=A0A8S9R6N6_BRACR|nr:hypothetical protein F2Q69_00016128 [Brassica cretica]
MGPGADIDTLCIGPSYVNREEDFFILLCDIFYDMEEVTELQHLDVDVFNSSVLCNVDEQTACSLNGGRVADQILKLVQNFEGVAILYITSIDKKVQALVISIILGRYMGPGADIDTLCIGPSYVNREDVDVFNSSVLCNVDEQTARSLNGGRVADQILKLVQNFEGVAILYITSIDKKVQALVIFIILGRLLDFKLTSQNKGNAH